MPVNLARASRNRWKPVAPRVSADPTPVRRLTRIAVLALMLTVAVRGGENEPGPGDWPQWRGPGRDGISRDTGLLKSWPSGGPPVLWFATDLGSGSGQPAIANGRVFCLGKEGSSERIQALDENSGKLLWSSRITQTNYSAGLAHGSCSTPTVDRDRVYALGGGGVLACLEATTGRILWQRNLLSDFGGRLHGYGYCESPLVDGDKVLVTPGSVSATVVALNKSDGATLWQCPIARNDVDQMPSLMAMTVEGRRLYVQSTQTGATGMAAENGAVLWSSDRGLYIATAICEGNRVLLDSCLISLANVDSRMTSQIVYDDVPLNAGYGGAVLIDGYVYGSRDYALSCSDLATGKRQWSRPGTAPWPSRRGSIAYADGHVYYRDEGGAVFLFEANPQRPVERGCFHDRASLSYAPPSIANRRLYLRGNNELWCYDVATKGASLLKFQDCAYQTEGERLRLRIARSDGLPLTKARATQAEILTTTDLNGDSAGWTLATNKSVLSNGVLTITVTRDPSEPARYYRVRESE